MDELDNYEVTSNSGGKGIESIGDEELNWSLDIPSIPSFSENLSRLEEFDEKSINYNDPGTYENPQQLPDSLTFESTSRREFSNSVPAEFPPITQYIQPDLAASSSADPQFSKSETPRCSAPKSPNLVTTDSVRNEQPFDNASATEAQFTRSTQSINSNFNLNIKSQYSELLSKSPNSKSQLSSPSANSKSQFTPKIHSPPPPKTDDSSETPLNSEMESTQSTSDDMVLRPKLATNSTQTQFPNSAPEQQFFNSNPNPVTLKVQYSNYEGPRSTSTSQSSDCRFGHHQQQFNSENSNINPKPKFFQSSPSQYTSTTNSSSPSFSHSENSSFEPHLVRSRENFLPSSPVLQSSDSSETQSTERTLTSDIYRTVRIVTQTNSKTQCLDPNCRDPKCRTSIKLQTSGIKATKSRICSNPNCIDPNCKTSNLIKNRPEVALKKPTNLTMQCMDPNCKDEGCKLSAPVNIYGTEPRQLQYVRQNQQQPSQYLIPYNPVSNQRNFFLPENDVHHSNYIHPHHINRNSPHAFNNIHINHPMNDPESLDPQLNSQQNHSTRHLKIGREQRSAFVRVKSPYQINAKNAYNMYNPSHPQHMIEQQQSNYHQKHVHQQYVFPIDQPVDQHYFPHPAGCCSQNIHYAKHNYFTDPALHQTSLLPPSDCNNHRISLHDDFSQKQEEPYLKKKTANRSKKGKKSKVSATNTHHQSNLSALENANQRRQCQCNAIVKCDVNVQAPFLPVQNCWIRSGLPQSQCINQEKKPFYDISHFDGSENQRIPFTFPPQNDNENNLPHTQIRNQEKKNANSSYTPHQPVNSSKPSTVSSNHRNQTIDTEQGQKPHGNSQNPSPPDTVNSKKLSQPQDVSSENQSSFKNLTSHHSNYSLYSERTSFNFYQQNNLQQPDIFNRNQQNLQGNFTDNQTINDTNYSPSEHGTCGPKNSIDYQNFEEQQTPSHNIVASYSTNDGYSVSHPVYTCPKKSLSNYKNDNEDHQLSLNNMKINQPSNHSKTYLPTQPGNLLFKKNSPDHQDVNEEQLLPLNDIKINHYNNCPNRSSLSVSHSVSDQRNSPHLQDTNKQSQIFNNNINLNRINNQPNDYPPSSANFYNFQKNLPQNANPQPWCSDTNGHNFIHHQDFESPLQSEQNVNKSLQNQSTVQEHQLHYNNVRADYSVNSRNDVKPPALVSLVPGNHLKNAKPQDRLPPPPYEAQKKSPQHQNTDQESQPFRNEATHYHLMRVQNFLVPPSTYCKQENSSRQQDENQDQRNSPNNSISKHPMSSPIVSSSLNYKDQENSSQHQYMYEEHSYNHCYNDQNSVVSSTSSNNQKALPQHQDANQEQQRPSNNSTVNFCQENQIDPSNQIKDKMSRIQPYYTGDYTLNYDRTIKYPNRKGPETPQSPEEARLLGLETQKNWCSVTYHEFSEQIGESFFVDKSHLTLTIDGYVDPCRGPRFCLGALPNVKRSQDSEKVRLHIGKGVVLEHHTGGDVWLRCMSDHCVYVQSYFLDRLANRKLGDTVHKIHPTAYVQVFDLRDCYRLMKSKVVKAQKASFAEAANLVGPSIYRLNEPEAFNFSDKICIDELRKNCSIRLSFVKGWGPDYPRAQIRETPCWVEIQLHRPLLVLDEILQPIKLSKKK